MSAADLDAVPAGDTTVPVLEGRHLVRSFRVGRRRLHALRDVSLALPARTSVALVGESGSGKSTAARVLVGAYRPDSGSVLLDGERIDDKGGRALLSARGRIQMVFQDPLASLDPRMSILRSVAEPLRVQRGLDLRAARPLVVSALAEVGLDADALERRPNAFSGGQRQRVAIARALIIDPEVLIGDEIVSALDVSVQAQILALLQRIRSERGLSLLLISHDLGLMHAACEVMYVMYLGRIVEHGPTSEIVSAPRHPYTAALVAAARHLGRRGADEQLLPRGEPPSPFDPPPGCPYQTRCPFAADRCRKEMPQLVPERSGRAAACHFPLT